MSHPASQSGLHAADSDIRQLFIRLAERDPDALDRLYVLTSSYVFGLALRILMNHSDAEEVTLDVYNRVWQSAAHYAEGQLSVIGLLLRMTRNLAIDKLRFNSARLRAEPHSIAQLDSLPGSSDNPEKSTILKQYGTRMRNAMASLTPEQKRALELAYFGGLSHSEIAGRLGLTLGTVKGHIRSGLFRLREALESSDRLP